MSVKTAGFDDVHCTYLLFVTFVLPIYEFYQQLEA